MFLDEGLINDQEVVAKINKYIMQIWFILNLIRAHPGCLTKK